MYSQQLKIKEHSQLEQTPHFIFLDALQSYLKLEQNTSKNQKLVESLYDKLQAIPKQIIQFNFYQNSISYHRHQTYIFSKASPFSGLTRLGIYKVRVLNTIELNAFEEFLSLLLSSVNKRPIKTHQFSTHGWGVYFKKTITPSFKSVLKKCEHEFSAINTSTNDINNLFSLLEILKTYPESVKLREDLEIFLFNLIKNQRYRDAFNLIESYTHKNYPLKSNVSLWSSTLIRKTLNHLKFFKILLEHEEACENLLSTIPTEFFILCFEHTENFILHPSKMIFVRYLARIHRGDSGFLQKIFSLSQNQNRLYQKTLHQLVYIMDASIDPNLVIDLAQNLSRQNKRKLVRLLLPHCSKQATCSWLIKNLNTLSKTDQNSILQHTQNINQNFVAQLLIDNVIKQKHFLNMDAVLKESVYDSVLANSPKLFTEHIQSHKLKKGLFYKIKYFNDYVCIEKVLKKNQYFSKSLTLKKIQKISQSYKIYILRKFYILLGLAQQKTT
ncbi:MAG TPA: hypothetical protein PKC21_10610 [Oligoflexia bacterium]|nr:hypothetical protein [Oligoflexia bacterium]HMR25787.1 hypothetical protein [Oligoflexia bacterium]